MHTTIRINWRKIRMKLPVHTISSCTPVNCPFWMCVRDTRMKWTNNTFFCCELNNYCNSNGQSNDVSAVDMHGNWWHFRKFLRKTSRFICILKIVTGTIRWSLLVIVAGIRFLSCGLCIVISIPFVFLSQIDTRKDDKYSVDAIKTTWIRIIESKLL